MGEDPDFGYLVATRACPTSTIPSCCSRAALRAQGRGDEYRGSSTTLKADRREYMKQHEGLRPEIIAALG
jgi:phosphoenolpyruvate carboxykinase (ATP)